MVSSELGDVSSLAVSGTSRGWVDGGREPTGGIEWLAVVCVAGVTLEENSAWRHGVMLVSEVNRTRRDVLGDDVSVTVSETIAPSEMVVSWPISEAEIPSGTVVSRVPSTGSFAVCGSPSEMRPLFD